MDTGLGNLNLYATMMAQSGLPIYNDSRTATAINTPEAISVFEQWTRLYTDYKFLKEADFYNRFSVGTMPLGYRAVYALFNVVTGRIRDSGTVVCGTGAIVHQ